MTESSPTTPVESPAQSDGATARGPDPVHVSPWTRGEQIKRQLWYVVQATLFRFSLHNAYRWRAFLLRLFGARLEPNVRIRASARIEVPWNLSIGSNSSIGDFAIVYCLGPITIGRNSSVSQYAHLCAGTHETNTRRMLLLRPPITIGDFVWIATDVFVGPGVTIGDRTLVGARSNVFSDLPPGVVAVGSPARPIRPREFVD
ncbi:MAG: WcaF family extracellular polysaccharide biosynthesis acetyltransferase [Phycisphaeraceae bacterium]|nr:WcaF family extracellular polysaccharide biosynthesis acetyltransferase [Phycisphaeraceae bacterium]MBX3405466.1 WcaF family extracellular polysaccharide biosynthesis acetyltransferase [Phycisphaeraceae bacterium]